MFKYKNVKAYFKVVTPFNEYLMQTFSLQSSNSSSSLIVPSLHALKSLLSFSMSYSR